MRLHLLVSSISGASGASQVLLSALDETDSAPTPTFNHSRAASAFSYGAATEVHAIATNTSGQIRSRESAADSQIVITLLGWTDTRGR